MNWLDVLVAVMLTAGGLFAVAGSIGMLRMPDFYTRMHAASITDTLGAGLILAGLVLKAGVTLASAKLLVLALLILFTSPAATHALAKAALERGLKPQLDEGEGKSSKP